MVSIGRLPQKAPAIDPITTAATKTDRQAMPWENDPIVQDSNAAAPWESDPVVEEAPHKKFSSTDIDPKMEAPAIVRAQVGALDKPEDRLAAIRKTYPDAQPYNGDNFIMTDPVTGKTMIYNQPGWLPSGGDFASILPEVGEGVGAVGGAIGGGLVGGTGGSIVPGAGTVAGTVAGGSVGAGIGATAGREATQRGLNYLFGNEDTRTTGEQIGDAAKTFALNAGGEVLGVGAGALLGKGARMMKGGPTKWVAGTADDPALAVQRAADFRGIGVEPTAGMVSGAPNTALKEQALAATRAGQGIQDRIGQAFGAMDNEAGRIVRDITPQTMTRQELGQALKDQSAALKAASKERGDYLYDQAGKLTGNAKASGANTRQFLEGLQGERAAMGKSASLNNGAALDDVIEQTKAIVDDIGNGVNFNTLKEARTNIGKIANDPGVDQVMRERAQGLYGALTKDMGETAESVGGDALQAWKKANNRFRRTNEIGGVFNTKNSLDPILKAQTPEQAADWVLGQVNKGGTRVNAVRRQIERTEGGPELWNTLSGSTVERMGIDASGNFSPTQMLRGWTKLSDEAKQAMFHGTARAQYRQDLDRLARVADTMKAYRRLDNHSNTTKAAGVLGEMNPFDKRTLLGAVFGGSVGGPSGALVALAGTAAGKGVNYANKRWQAKLLTSPETVNWLSRVPQAEMQRGGLTAHVKELAKIGASTSDNALATAIDGYLRDIGYDAE